MRRTIGSRSYASSVDEAVSLLASREPSLDVRHLLIVPDVYTLMMEKRLFGGGGAFDLEVTTFSRLYSRLHTGGEQPLGKQGALMLLRRICRENEGRLTVYARSCRRAGFAAKLYDALNDLRASAVSCDDLAAAGEVHKAGDLALLYREYTARTRGRYVDAAGRNELLRRAVESGALKDCHVYVALYDRFPRSLRLLLDSIEEHSLSLTVFTVGGEHEKVTAPVQAAMCATQADSYKTIARKIREFVKSGAGDWGDVCVVDDSCPAVAARVFTEYGIPYYMRAAIPLAQTELGRFVLGMLDCVRRGRRAADMLALAQNYYLGVEIGDAGAFRSYVMQRCVDYGGFAREFAPSATITEECAAAAERVRVRIAEFLKTIEEAGCRYEDVARAITAALERANAAERTRELAAADGRGIESIYDKTTELIELFASLNAGEKTDLDTAYDILREGLTGTEIRLVPTSAGAVQIGPLALFRGSRPKMTAIAGFNEGVLPRTVADDGLLSDADADKLIKHNVDLGPKTPEKNELARFELNRLLSSSGRIVVTYGEDGAKPSYDCRRLLLSSSPEIIENEITGGLDEVEICARLGSEAGALEHLLTHLSAPYAPSIVEALGEKCIPYIRKTENVHALSPTRKLFMRDGRTSVSAIQTYFSCPYKYFFQYGLRLKPDADGKVTPLDTGNLLHAVIERYVSEKMPDDVPTFVRRVVSEQSEITDKYRLEANGRVIADLVAEAETLCLAVRRQIEAGEFTLRGTEIPFGRAESPFARVKLGGGVELEGKMDRVDEWKGYARVIDYKTGAASFSYADLYYGQKIQLMLYLYVLEKSGYRPAGAFYFPFSVGWRDDEFSHVLSGAYNADPDVLLAFDRGMTEKGKSRVIAASVTSFSGGRVKIRKNKLAVTEDDLMGLARYARSVADGAVREIEGGFISPSPVRTSFRSTSCDYCDYRAICGGAAPRSCPDVKPATIIDAVKDMRPSTAEVAVKDER